MGLCKTECRVSILDKQPEALAALVTAAIPAKSPGPSPFPDRCEPGLRSGQGGADSGVRAAGTLLATRLKPNFPDVPIRWLICLGERRVIGHSGS